MDLFDVAKQIIDAAGAAASGVRVRQAVVDAIADDGTLTVRVAGSATQVAGVRAFSSCDAVAGESVWVIMDGQTMFAIGRIGVAGATGSSRPAPGIVEAWGGSLATIPAGSLACDGASYLRSAYPDLFAAIGTTWGAVDGSHFNVPPKDRFYVAAGATYAPGATGGYGSHTHGAHAAHEHYTPATGAADRALYADSAGSHSHGGNTADAGTQNTKPQGSSTTFNFCQTHHHVINADGAHTHTVTNHLHTTGGWTNSGPGAMAHDLQSNLPPYAALPHIIWT